MLKWLIDFSIRNATLVVAMAALGVVLIGVQVGHMPVDVFPELNAPTVVILSEAGGLAADEVEQSISYPIETSMTGVTGVRRVRSSSSASLSIVWVEFDWGTDIYRARQLVSEQLTLAREMLPPQAHPEIAPVTSITGEIMLISLTSSDGTVSPLKLREYAEYQLSRTLMGVPGVAKVVSIGGELPEYRVIVRQEELLRQGLTFAEVSDAARKAHGVAPGGILSDHQGMELAIRQDARARTIEDIGATPVAWRGGAPLTLAQVAEVRLMGAPARGTGGERGNPAVVLSIQKAPGINTMELTAAIDGTLDAAASGIPKGATLNRHVMRQSDFIGLSLRNVSVVCRDAIIFVALVLILFLLNVRTTLITLTALPVSLAAALAILWSMGLSINVMTLGGLAVAIGELVDDAIIDVENVHRRLGENAMLDPSRRREGSRVIFDASNEIRSSVVFATLIIVIVFVPLLFLEGLEGRFFRPLGIAYIASIGASLLVALTVTPALCKLLLAKVRHKPGAHTDAPLVRWLKRAYVPTLRWALKVRWALLCGSLVLTGGALWFASGFGSSFLPEFNEGTFTVFLTAPPGTSLTESDRLARGVERRMAEIPGVRSVVRRTGRAERDEHAEPVSSSEIEVSFDPDAGKRNVRAALKAVLADVPGISTTIGQPIEHRLSHVMSGTPAAIAISVFGDDLDTLRRIAKEIESVLTGLEGATDISANREIMTQTLPVRYDRAALARCGLAPAEAAEQVEAAFYGSGLGDIYDGVYRRQLVVRLDEPERDDPSDLRAFVLRSPAGPVRLSEVASIGPEMASNLIVHEGGRRKALISLNVAEGHNLGHLVAEVRSRIDPIIARHPGTSVHYGGQFEAQQSASRTIGMVGVGVCLLIFLLLSMALASAKSALLVMINLPLALIGGVIAVYLSASADVFGNTLALFGIGDGRYVAPIISISSMVGFVTLFGIAVRNGILLVNHYQHLMRNEKLDLEQAIVIGSEQRLVPILMTALTAILGLIPIALAAGEPGSELLAPLAIVVLGGLLTSTFLNLVVVPAGFFILYGKSTKGATT